MNSVSIKRVEPRHVPHSRISGASAKSNGGIYDPRMRWTLKSRQRGSAPRGACADRPSMTAVSLMQPFALRTSMVDARESIAWKATLESLVRTVSPVSSMPAIFSRSDGACRREPAHLGMGFRRSGRSGVSGSPTKLSNLGAGAKVRWFRPSCANRSPSLWIA